MDVRSDEASPGSMHSRDGQSKLKVFEEGLYAVLSSLRVLGRSILGEEDQSKNGTSKMGYDAPLMQDSSSKTDGSPVNSGDKRESPVVTSV